MKATITHLAQTNKRNYNYLKCVEELTELSEVLMKRVLKGDSDKNPSDKMIIEEIGDVELRVEILKEMLNCDKEVLERKEYKLSKYKQYIENNQYKNGI